MVGRILAVLRRRLLAACCMMLRQTAPRDGSAATLRFTGARRTLQVYRLLPGNFPVLPFRSDGMKIHRLV